MKYISCRLHTIIRQRIQKSGITDSYCARVSFKDQFEPDRIFTIFADAQASSKDDLSGGSSSGNAAGVCLMHPVILTVSARFVYALVPAADRRFIIGPVRLSPSVRFRHTHSAPPADRDWADTVPVCGFNDLADCVLLLCNLCREDEITAEMLIAENCIDPDTGDELRQSFSELVFENREKGKDIPSVFHLFHTAEYEYAQMVKELKKRREGIPVSDRNPHIDKCKNYIFSHLHGRISVRGIADAIGLNAGYLSELFHECENVTLTEYIRREKISLAKNLLTYSEYTCSEIATYLGFSSQSHLGKYFRDATGMTMRQYRTACGVRTFESGKSPFTGE